MLKRKSTENLIIFVLLLAVLLLGGYLSYTRMDVFKNKADSLFSKEGELELNLHDFGDFSIATQLNKNEASALADFIKISVKEELLPTELTIVGGGGQNGEESPEPEYRGTWNKDGVFWSALYVSGPIEDTPQYLRLWVVVPGEEVTKEKSIDYVGQYFKDEFLEKTGREEISCREVVAEGEEVTECGKLKTQEDGTLQGTTLRAPIYIEESGEAANIIISACFVPNEGAQFYNSPLCI